MEVYEKDTLAKNRLTFKVSMQQIRTCWNLSKMTVKD